MPSGTKSESGNWAADNQYYQLWETAWNTTILRL